MSNEQEMRHFIGKVKMTCEWEVQLQAESLEDAQERIECGDWDVTRDMVMESDTAKLVELFELDGAEPKEAE